MIRLSGSGNYTLSRIRDGMTITNTLSNTGVETSLNTWDCTCGSERMQSMSFVPRRVASTVILLQNSSIPKGTLRTGGGRDRKEETVDVNNVPIDVKTMLRVGDTLLPKMFMSNGTHLSNYAGDKKAWPVYLTIGNVSSKICQMPSMHSVVMVTFQRIPIKNCPIRQKRLDEQRHTEREVLNEVLHRVLQPLTCKQNPSANGGYYNVLCADAEFRRW